MEQILAEQRIHIRDLLNTIVRKYDYAHDVLKSFEANPELDVHMLASIMQVLAELETKIANDEEIGGIFRNLEDINERVMVLAEDMKI